MPPRPIRVSGGLWAAFWRWQEHDPEARPPPRETGELLRQLHELLSGCPIELPALDPITANPRLPSLGAEAELDRAAVEFLAVRYQELERGWRRFQTELGSGPIHGDFNLSNILVSSGRPFLIDFDRVATGPREWDLAGIAPPRVLGWTEEEWVAFSEGYGYDLLGRAEGRILQELVHVRSLIWMLSHRQFRRRLERGRLLLDEWLRRPGASCLDLDWQGAFRAFPLPA
jgi:Ser/Thr protein kinase RdoA (MazF antagonist)